MKKIISISMIIVSMLTIATTATARDLKLEAVIQNLETRETRNGKPFATGFITEERKLAGVKYTAQVKIITFEESVINDLMSIPDGQVTKMIVSSGTYQGQKNYTVLHIIK